MDDEILVEITDIEGHGSVAIAYGTDTANGDSVSFAGDTRPMYDIAEAIAATGEPVVSAVPSWAILSRSVA